MHLPMFDPGKEHQVRDIVVCFIKVDMVDIVTGWDLSMVIFIYCPMQALMTL